MMGRTVNVHEAKTHLSRLLEDVRHGEEIVIAKNGMPYAKLVPLPNRGGPRKPGDDEKITYIAGEGEAEAGGRAS